MVFLQVDQLLFQTLHLHLQVWPGRGQVIQDPAQSGDVPLHWHAHRQLILKPVNKEAPRVMFLHQLKWCYHQQKNRRSGAPAEPVTPAHTADQYTPETENVHTL